MINKHEADVKQIELLWFSIIREVRDFAFSTANFFATARELLLDRGF
jgi:hypothetical protein